MDRWACVDIAALPLQLLLRANPAWDRRPAAVVEDDRPQALVLYVNAHARRGGISAGLKYAAALALIPDLQADTVAASEIARQVLALAGRLRRYSPHVEPASHAPGIFWLDGSGLDRLYASTQAWADNVRDDLARAGFVATIAVAFSRLGSYALARTGRGTIVCASEADERSRVRRVPMAALDLEAAVRERLSALGIHTVGEFLRLPADRIRTQFGSATDTLYQLAAGSKWAPLLPAPPEERHEQEMDFDTPESSTERLVFGVKRLLDGLMPALTARGLAVGYVALELKLDDRSSRVERVQPATPTLNVTQLVSLIRLRLESCRFSAGLVTLRVMAGTVAASLDERRLFAQHGRRDPAGANQAFARLRAELGDECVVRARLCQAHLPGSRFTWDPIAQMPVRSAPQVVSSRPLVRRIYTRPIPMPAGANPLAAAARGGDLAGPYTISGGWWGGGVHRDYYYARSERGDLWWFYYDARRRRLFLQGTVE